MVKLSLWSSKKGEDQPRLHSAVSFPDYQSDMVFKSSITANAVENEIDSHKINSQ